MTGFDNVEALFLFGYSSPSFAREALFFA